MNQGFYDYHYFVLKRKGGAEMHPSDAITIIRRFQKWGGKELFDIGCGTGILIAEARRKGIDAYGCDFSEFALTHAEPDAKFFMSLYDATKPFPDMVSMRKFEWVILYSVLEHLDNEQDVRQVVANAMSITKPEGKIFCLICEEYRQEELSHCFLHSRDWWLELFRGYGMHDVSKHYYEEMGEELNIPKVARDEIFILQRI